VRFTAELENHEVGACHCSMCRRETGSVWMALRALDLTFDRDDTLRWYTSSDWAERGFCSTCGASLFYRVTVEPYQGNTFVAMGALDDSSGLVLTSEMFTDRRPEGYRFAGDLQGMTEAEAFAMLSPNDGL
jgi:hypothetical protein